MVQLAFARLKELARLIKRPRIAGLLGGPTPGIVVVTLFCLGLLYASFRASDRYYETHLVIADSSYSLAGPSLLVSGKNDFSLRRVLNHPAPLPSSDSGTTVYVLHTVAAWYLRHFLPLRPSMAVVLNGIWFWAMGLCVYALFWSRLRKWALAAVVTVGYLVANPYLPTITYGITSLDPNLVGFMLGTSALCCTMLSNHFQRLIPCLLVGAFLGLLCLGRVYTLGVVLPAMLPYVVSCFWRRSKREMLLSVQGGFLALCVAFAISGWFLRAHWQTVLAYPTQYADAGVLSHMPFVNGIWEWLRFPKAVLAENLTFLCALSWPVALSFVAQQRSLKDFNWRALWVALVPLLILAKMGTTFRPYGAVAMLGVFLVLLFPFASPDPAPIYRGRFAAALTMGCSFSCWAFFGSLSTTHEAGNDNKSKVISALETMRLHAAAHKRKRVTVGLVHWGKLHDAALVNALVSDLKLRVATPDFQPKRRASNPLIVDPLVTDPWAWDPKVAHAAVITPAVWANRIIHEADYVFVLAGDRRQDRREGRWPPWVEASDLIRESGVFERLTPPFHVKVDGPVELLVRRQSRSP
ncbi:MAG TPA: hypothetical protein VHP33_09475 [Polyangiaceae bacterium]|nr:hypothetical protein [Polyangiaceae bacterium]